MLDGRIMGLDIGDKTIGVAVSDLMGLTAQGVTTIKRVGKKKDIEAIKQILQTGPQAIFNTFGRKISMNLKLAKSSVWVNILLVGIAVIGIFIFRPSKHMKHISNQYPMIFKGFIASMVGCLITLLVNDSGIVAAATASIYILIPILVISINMIIFKSERE